MTPEYANQIATELLISGLLSVLAVGLLTVFLLMTCLHLGRSRALRAAQSLKITPAPAPTGYRPSILEHTCRWVAIKSNNLTGVQSALDLHNPIPCSWGEGMSRLASRELFVSPPIGGWILVVGQGLPDPSDDIDRCFHFVTRLSRALGHVQFFSAHRAVDHHAWVKVEHGHIQRAYAWAGETLWNQGDLTQAEIDLRMKCFQYGQTPEMLDLSTIDSNLPNSDKVLALAARWSFDPTTINESMVRAGVGVAGDLTHSRQP